MDYAILPSLNAGLNATSAILVAAGHRLIRRGRIAAHRACMTAAVAASALFLTSYLAYHSRAGITRFTRQGLIRAIYFAILVSHTILAVVIVPLVLVSFTRGLRGQFARHVPIARWTYPIWLYVSVTGVIVYLMLYHL